MMIDRRTFIKGVTLLAVTPALEALLPFSSTSYAHASMLPCTQPPQMAGEGTSESLIVFKIEGWDRCDDPGTDRLLPNSASKVSTANQASIRINQSWRCGWR